MEGGAEGRGKFLAEQEGEVAVGRDRFLQSRCLADTEILLHHLLGLVVHLLKGNQYVN